MHRAGWTGTLAPCHSPHVAGKALEDIDLASSPVHPGLDPLPRTEWGHSESICRGAGN